MMNMLNKMSFRQKIFLASAVIFCFIAYFAVIAISRVGEVKVSVNVIPYDAKIMVDGKSVSSEALYLSKGDHKFTAEKSGWKTDTQTINISKSSVINLLPEPESDEAKNWLKDNPDIQLEREKLGGENAARSSEEAAARNPIINLLPVTEIEGPFSIDYGPSKTRPGSIFLLVSDSSPNGRVNAQKWIRQNGFDLTDFEIIYSDFINPLHKDEERAH